MIDELTIYNLSVKYPNTVDLVREVEKMVRADAIEEYKHNLKETFNNEFPINYHSTQPYFTLDNVRALADAVAREMKEQK